ncbi:MAG: MgtC/SapB family protein [Bacteroidetes bacterium]|nr:MgtC/SapB family protein [Bacteroidota bacterium]
MDWNIELIMTLRALLSAVLGAAIGYEREGHGGDAGIRTYAAVSLGACIFGLISSHIPDTDPARIAAGVVTGVGFLGAGVILREQGRIAGLTTAATVWATASVGLAISFGMYILGTLTSVIIFSLLSIHHLKLLKRLKRKRATDEGD